MRIVIKVGTSTLAYPTYRLNIQRAKKLVEVISDLQNAGNEMILVSSGAIAMGAGKLMLADRPSDIPTKQAAAAVGQCELMYTYDNLFSEYNHTVAQLLLTGSDFQSEERKTNFINTMSRLLELKVIPVINENDTVTTDEIKVGDNDTLASQVAVNVKADLLVLLSDIDGLYTDDPHKNPNAKLITKVDTLDEGVMSLGGDSTTNLGTGGMKTKLSAAKRCVEAGCEMVIANGEKPELIYTIVNGGEAGTRFLKRQ